MDEHRPKNQEIQHWIMFSDLASAKHNECCEMLDEEAHHALKVKRVRLHDTVGVLDGQGHHATATVTQIAGSRSKPTLTIQIEQIQSFAPIAPIIEIFAALPKGDRLDRMIDQLAQLGVSTFRPLLCERSQRKPSTIRPEKLERIATESTKQCRRPWAIQINDPIPFADAINDPDAVVADAAGIPWNPSTASQRTAILIGPEGGFSPAERALMSATGVPLVRFGLFVLRIESAAAAASAIVLSNAPQPRGTPI
jgi:16S rRNA (uracil1498-N3)-methyltransferase